MNRIFDLRLTEWSFEELAALEIAVQEAQRWKEWHSIDRDAARRALWAREQWARERETITEREAILEQAYAEQNAQELPTQESAAVKLSVVETPAKEGTAPALTVVKVTEQERTAEELPAPDVAAEKVCVTKVTPSRLYPRNADVFIDVPPEFFSEAIMEHPRLNGLLLSGEQRRFSGRLEYLVEGQRRHETVSEIASRLRWKAA